MLTELQLLHNVYYVWKSHEQKQEDEPSLVQISPTKDNGFGNATPAKDLQQHLLSYTVRQSF